MSASTSKSQGSHGLGDDLVIGVENIAKFYYGPDAGQKEQRRVYGWCEAGAIPSFKIGGIWHLRPSTARKDIERRERRVAGE